MTNQQRRYWSGTDSLCPLCKNHKETAFHLFWTCEFIKSIKVKSNVPRPVNQISNIAELVDDWLKPGPQIFEKEATICWLVWKARCKVVFEKTEASVQGVLGAAEAWFSGVRNPQVPIRVFRRATDWSPSNTRGQVINVDAAFNLGSACIATVRRTNEGKIISIQAAKAAAMDPGEAQAKALLMGIEEARRSITWTLVYSDASSIISWVNNQDSSPP